MISEIEWFPVSEETMIETSRWRAVEGRCSFHAEDCYTLIESLNLVITDLLIESGAVSGGRSEEA